MRARYLVHNSGYIDGVLFRAKTVHRDCYDEPIILELPPHYTPSRTWEPLNSEATEALRSIGQVKEIASASDRYKVVAIGFQEAV